MTKLVCMVVVMTLLSFLTCKGEICKADDEQVIKYAKSAVLIDGDTGRILYEKNSHDRLSVASTTKIMTCIVALENGNLQDMVTPSDYAISMPKVKMYMKANEQYKLEDLLYAMMLESYNDVAVAVAEHISGSVEGFANLMNIKARELGMSDSNFVTPNGLDAKNQYSSAYDMALIGAYAVKNEEFIKITNTKSYSFTTSKNRTITVSNKDAFLDKMNTAIGIKTGFTGSAGYCFVGAVKDGEKNLISCVLACGWPPNKGYKWTDTMNLMKYGEKYTKRNIVMPSDEFQKINIEKGVEKDLGTYTEEQIDILLCDDDTVTYKTEITNSTAPIEKNEVVGVENVFVNGKHMFNVKIKAKEKIRKFDYWYCLKKLGDVLLL